MSISGWLFVQRVRSKPWIRIRLGAPGVRARFGELDVHYLRDYTVPGLPQVRIFSNVVRDGRATGATGAGMYWHSDTSYKEIPVRATLLYGIQCPPERAHTQFADMYSAYEALSEATKERLKGLRAIHDRNYRYSNHYSHRSPLTPEQIADVPPVEHPMVRIHPVTRRRRSTLRRAWFRTLSGSTSKRGEGSSASSRSSPPGRASCIRTGGGKGDTLVWDNRCTLHRATPFDPKYQRTLYRVQARGEQPIPA